MSARPAPSRGGMPAVYGVWVALTLLAGLAVIEVHTFLQGLSMALQLNPWVARAVRQLALPILGLIWLILIFWLEYWLRTGARKGVLWRRVGRVTAAIVGVIVVAYVLRTIG
jgi:hypothetical protein